MSWEITEETQNQDQLTYANANVTRFLCLIATANGFKRVKPAVK